MTFKKTAETLSPNATTLKREYYTNPNILEEEYEKIFSVNWVCAGRISDFQENSQYQVLNIGRESVIILRDDQGELKAFYNVCRHRGTRICNNSSGKFSKSIQCGYHGWTYDLKGELIGAPHMEEISGFDKQDFPLHPVEIAEWEGFIFINLMDEPEEFEQFFEPLIGRFNAWGLPNLVTEETREYAVKSNWKLVVQNYCECYHCPILHPELAAIHYYMGGKNDLYDGPFLGGYMDFNKDKKSITESGELSCPPLEGLKGDDLNRVYYYYIFPNMLLSMHPDYVMYHSVWPKGVDECKVTCHWLFSKETVNSGNYNTKDAINFWDMTNNQDWYISELSQLGVQSKKYFPSPYSGQESLLAAFDKFYLSRLESVNGRSSQHSIK